MPISRILLTETQKPALCGAGFSQEVVIQPIE
jgi:hypothetical protein